MKKSKRNDSLQFFTINVWDDSQGHYQTEDSEQLKELFCVHKAELNVEFVAFGYCGGQSTNEFNKQSDKFPQSTWGYQTQQTCTTLSSGVSSNTNSCEQGWETPSYPLPTNFLCCSPAAQQDVWIHGLVQHHTLLLTEPLLCSWADRTALSEINS